MADLTETTTEEVAGVLLYYKYAPVADVPSLVAFFDSNCRSLSLLGRVRIAPDGVNVTIGGDMSSLEKHIEAVKSMSLFDGTDFKLASCDHPHNERIARECGFTSLSIRVVKELVTFRSHPLLSSPKITDAGKHLSASEFHSFLQSADSQELVLLDARNLYETRIGKFQTTNVVTLDPEIRQYSDLPAWIDEHAEELHNKNVLMYCTGGIRCEMASAYIRSKGAGFKNVFQLYGGIQRYLEQFPEGGYFKGKNFVFDHRISVGTQSSDVIGNCLICSSSFDDYSTRCRCHYCRMLVLVCYKCQGKSGSIYACELCQRNGKRGKVVHLDNELHEQLSPDSRDAEIDKATILDNFPSWKNSRSYCMAGNLPRKLRILCLHGFRQNALNFMGRTQSLAKKLKNMAEFVFVDAPHALPHIYQPRLRELHTCPEDLVPPVTAKKKFAWLVSPSSTLLEEGWKMANVPFDRLQYQEQSGGFAESYSYLESKITELGPFDGILGFSQGAAMAALFCEKQQRNRGSVVLRFAILCSGYLALTSELEKELIRLPSLHCFGNKDGEDRQIDCQASRQLAELFDTECSSIIEHGMGHIIPTRSPYIDQMKEFLQRFI